MIGANRIYETAALMLPVALAALALGSVLGHAFGAPGMVVGIIAGELCVSVLLIRAVTRWLRRDIGDFARKLAQLDRIPDLIRSLAGRLKAARS